MKRLTKKEAKAVVEQWKRAGPRLERFRREELVKSTYDWTTVDAMLDAGDRFGASRSSSGLVEMQRLFIKAARRRKPLSRSGVGRLPDRSTSVWA